MKNIPIKLKELVNEFHYFEDNQVLTASHLNAVVDFLDRRDRMTRTRLIGTGIVCGLEATFNNSNKVITLSKGSAITSDGDLIHLDKNTIYSRVKVFEDAKAKYHFFHNEEETIPLYQLFEADTKEENTHSLRGVNNPVENIGEMVLVLYLESFLKAPEDCTEVDCENHGMRQVAKLIPLLISKSDLKRIQSKNSKIANPYFNLPEVEIHRIDYHNKTITHEENLLARFEKAISDSKNSIITALKKSCSGAFMENIISTLYPNPSSIWSSKLEGIFNNINLNDRPDVIYIYEFLKDLTQAYNEFKDAIFELWFECCPEPAFHPKHILVNELKVDNENRPAIFRHHFCESPVLNLKGKQMRLAKHLHQRINEMIKHFSIPNNTNLSIEITPSKQGDYSLGEKSIPYYYTNKSTYTLNKYWSFEKTIKDQTKSILGYRAEQYDGNNTALNPLKFLHQDCNFYRIEGHLGKPKNEVEERLEKLKVEYNLQFNVVAVQIQDELRTVRIPRLKLPGVNALFHHYREEFNSNIKIVDQFNADLDKITPAEVSQEEKSPKDVMNENLAQSKEQITGMKDQMVAAKNKVRSKIDSFEKNYKLFKTDYQRAASKGDLIHTKMYDYTQTKYEPPIQKFVLDYKFNRFDGLIKYFRKKKQKVQEQYIFEKFYNQNPGIESLCGVPKGGTFILVYTSSDNEDDQRIVADFCLPSCCVVEIDPEVDPKEITEEEIEKPEIDENIKPIRFIEKIDLFKYSPIKSIVEQKVSLTTKDLSGQIQAIKDLNLVAKPGIELGIKGQLEDNLLKDMVGGLDKTVSEIKFLEGKDSRTPEEDKKLDFLLGHYDKTSESLLDLVMKKDGDIQITSDEAKIIEYLGKNSSEIESKDALKKFDKKSKDLAEKNDTNPIKREMGRKLINWKI